MSTQNPTLAAVNACASPVRQHPFQEYLDIITAGCLETANAWCFTVRCGEGSRTVEVRLTEAHYTFLAPHLTDLEKAVIAMAVLENKVEPQSDTVWDVLWCRLRKEMKSDEEHWLPHMVVAQGFDAIAVLMKQWIVEYRRDNPPPRLNVVCVEKPTWSHDAGLLVFGNENWPFRRDHDGPLVALFDELEKHGWPASIRLPHLDPEQVRDVAKALRKKTHPHLYWKAESDGTLVWFVP